MWWRFGRRMKSPEMGTLWDSFGLVLSSGSGDSGGCGFQRAVEHIFSKDRGHHEEEDTHRCILHFPSMRELFTHEELEQALVQMAPLLQSGRAHFTLRFGNDCEATCTLIRGRPETPYSRFRQICQQAGESKSVLLLGTQGRVISYCRRPCYSQLTPFTNSANLWSTFKIHWTLISMMRAC